MTSHKLIVILGATGMQGGSVVNTFLQDPIYKIRGVTRNASSEKAKALKSKGIEVVSASLDDEQSLITAFKDANIVFSTTDYWGAFSDPANQKKAAEAGKSSFEWTYDYELQQGKNAFDAASKIPGLERLIVSGLSNASKWSQGNYKRVFHFDAKAHALDYGREMYPDLWAKTSVIQVGWYLSNWTTVPMMTPKKDDEGTYNYAVGVPSDLKLPLIATEVDTGPFVKALLQSPPGKNLIAYREWMSIGEIATIWTKVLGVPAKVTTIPLDENAADEFMRGFAQNMKYFIEYGYEGRDDPSLVHPRDLDGNVNVGSVEDWVRGQDWSGVLAAEG